MELHDDIVNLGSHGVGEWEQEVEYVRELAVDEIEKFKSDWQGTIGDLNLRVIGDHRDRLALHRPSCSERISQLHFGRSWRHSHIPFILGEIFRCSKWFGDRL